MFSVAAGCFSSISLKRSSLTQNHLLKWPWHHTKTPVCCSSSSSSRWNRNSSAFTFFFWLHQFSLSTYTNLWRSTVTQLLQLSFRSASCVHLASLMTWNDPEYVTLPHTDIAAWIIHRECFVFGAINTQKIIRFMCCSTDSDRQEALWLQRQTCLCVCVCLLPRHNGLYY